MLKNRILVIGPTWVGDMVMAQSLFKILKKRFPDSPIDVLAPAWSTPLLKGMPEISEAIELDIGHGVLNLYQRYQMGVALRERGYRAAYILPNSFKSALIPFWAKIPVRIGYKGEMRYGVLTEARALDKQKLPKMVQRFAALGYEHEEARAPGFLPDCPRPVLEQVGDSKVVQESVLVLCPGAEFGPSKRWPEKYYAQVANYKIKQGWVVWILGSKNDRAVAENIMNKIEYSSQASCLNFAGKTSLEEAINLLAASDLVLTNDSGLMHIAAALSKPLIALYGSTDPNYTPPLSDKAILIQEKMACSPCFKRECPLKSAQYHACMEQLSPDTVLNQIENLCAS